MARRPQPGRKVRDLDDARTLLQAWQDSEETLAVWCSRHDINVCSLAAYKRWADQGNQEIKTHELEFLELEFTPEPQRQTNANYTIHFQNGRALQLDDRFEDDALRRLLLLVETC